MNSLYSLTPKEIAILSTVVAIELSEGKSLDQQNVLGNFLSTVGDIILTIAAQGQAQSSESSSE